MILDESKRFGSISNLQIQCESMQQSRERWLDERLSRLGHILEAEVAPVSEELVLSNANVCR